MINADPIKLAWAAGFIDGEGYIGANEAFHRDKGVKPSYSLIIDLAQVKREPLEAIQTILGGSIREVNTKYGVHYNWRLYSNNAAEVIQAVLPYLIAKRSQALLAMEFHAAKVHGRQWANSSEYDKQRAIYIAFKELNKRRTKRDAERLSEGAPVPAEQDDAIVRSHGNSNHETVAEMATALKVVNLKG